MKDPRPVNYFPVPSCNGSRSPRQPYYEQDGAHIQNMTEAKERAGPDGWDWPGVALDHGLRYSEMDDPFTWPITNQLDFPCFQYGRIKEIAGVGDQLLVRMERETLGIRGNLPHNYEVAVVT